MDAPTKPIVMMGGRVVGRGTDEPLDKITAKAELDLLAKEELNRVTSKAPQYDANTRAQDIPLDNDDAELFQGEDLDFDLDGSKFLDDDYFDDRSEL